MNTAEDEIPPPLVPPDVDLRGLPYMPLDITRLLDSDFYALSTGSEFKAAVTLWIRSFQQIPAASLPDDERVLAHLSYAGPAWAEVRDMAMRGWIKCSDGRLYHPVVAEKAMTAWAGRMQFQEMVSHDAERKRRERDDRSKMFTELKAVGIIPPWNCLTKDLREQHRTHVTSVTPPVTTTSTAPVQVKPQRQLGREASYETVEEPSDQTKTRPVTVPVTEIRDTSRSVSRRQRESENHNSPAAIDAGLELLHDPALTDHELCLPSWLPRDEWDAWIEIRKKAKAPNTKRALKFALEDLDRLRQLGDDPSRVLKRAVTGGWKSLYALPSSDRVVKRNPLDPFPGAI